MYRRNIPEPAAFTRSRILLSRLEYASGDRYSCTLHDEESAQHPACIHSFLERELNLGIWDSDPLQIVDCPGLSDLPALQSDIAGKILLSMHINGSLPRTTADLARVIGLAYGARTWGTGKDDNLLARPVLSQEDCRITCVEDVYEYLTRLKIPEEDVLYFTDGIRTGSLNISCPLYRRQLDRCDCEKWFFDAVNTIDSLMFRPQCLQQALETKRLIYYRVKYPDIYRREYDMLITEESETAKITGPAK